MQTFSPESTEPAGDTDGDPVAQFLRDVAAPLRARGRPQRPDPLPKASQLLAEALRARRIRVKKVVEGRWVFEFAGTVIGGYSLTGPPGDARPRSGGGITTLVSSHARRVLRDAERVRMHFDLMEIPHPAPLPESAADEITPPLFDIELLAPAANSSTLPLRAYAVGRETISLLAVVPDEDGGILTVDVTDRAAEEIRSLAVDAMRAIPGLFAAAVALEVESLDSAEGAQVVGIDETASIVPHHFPGLGTGRPVADAIAEQMLFTAAL